MNIFKILPKAALFGLLSACVVVPQPEPRLASAEEYEEASCATIVAERNTVANQVAELTDTEAKDGGVVVLPPVVFAVGTIGVEDTEMIELKSRYDALTEAGNAKGCFG